MAKIIFAFIILVIFSILVTFAGKRHAKTRHVMGCHGITRHSHGKVRKKGGRGLHWYEQYCKLKLKTKIGLKN